MPGSSSGGCSGGSGSGTGGACLQVHVPQLPQVGAHHLVRVAEDDLQGRGGRWGSQLARRLPGASSSSILDLTALNSR